MRLGGEHGIKQPLGHGTIEYCADLREPAAHVIAFWQAWDRIPFPRYCLQQSEEVVEQVPYATKGLNGAGCALFAPAAGIPDELFFFPGHRSKARKGISFDNSSRMPNSNVQQKLNREIWVKGTHIQDGKLMLD